MEIAKTVKIWVCCPKCHRRLFPVGSQTVIRNLVFRCRHCKEEFEVNI